MIPKKSLLYEAVNVAIGGASSAVASTTTEAKAVKVRFVEGRNSQEALDFNLYLHPNKSWTGVVLNQTT